MKKILNLFIVFSLIFVMTSCTAKTEVRKFEGNINNMKIENTFTAKDNKIIKQVGKNTLKFIDVNLKNKEDIETIKKEVEAKSKEINKLKGVKEEVKFTDEEMIETIEIDYTQADLKKLNELGFIQITDSNATYLAMDKTVQTQLDAGLKEVK